MCAYSGNSHQFDVERKQEFKAGRIKTSERAEIGLSFNSDNQKYSGNEEKINSMNRLVQFATRLAPSITPFYLSG